MQHEKIQYIKTSILLPFLFVLSFFFVLSSPFTSHAAIEDPLRWYVGMKLGFAGIVAQDIQTDLGTAYSKGYSRFMSTFAIGGVGGLQTHIAPHTHFRAELEYIYHMDVHTKQSYPGEFATKFNLLTHTLLTNIYFDYAVIKFVSLYASAGIGVALLQVDANRSIATQPYRTRKLDANFAWQLGFGTRVAVSEYIMADFNLRYVDTGKINPIGRNSEARMRVRSTGAFEAMFSVAYLF